MLRILLVGLSAALLSACASLNQPPLPVTDESHELWQQRQQGLALLDAWSIRGRVAIFVEEKVYNLGLGWNRHGDESTLKLEASLGQGVIQLQKSNTQVELTTSEGDLFEGSNAEQVLYQSSGLVIPVEGLETWIKGIPHQSTRYLPDIDGLGHAITIQQDGWKINYFDYEVAPISDINWPLPRKIYMKRENLALKIVIDQWQNQADTTTSDLFPQFPD